LIELMYAREAGQAVDAAALTTRIRAVVGEVVRHQAAVGLDVINDGEVGRASYSTYVKDRFRGFGGPGERTGGTRPDAKDFPEWAARVEFNPARARLASATCDGPVTLADPDAVHRDLASLREALAGVPYEDAFVTAPSPVKVSHDFPNRYYPSWEAYVAAIAEAMRHEYRAIVEAGFILQVDCPDLGGSRARYYGDLPMDEFLRRLRFHVEMLNHALEGLPPEQMRVHLCWSNYPGPHHLDVPLEDIVEVVLQVRPSGIAMEGANPRHEHEWAVFKDVKLPAGKVLIPGVIDSCTNYIEHPELVAQRIKRYARVVGRENVIAGVDCGLSTFVGSQWVDPRIAWAKLESLVEGARLASRALW
jgi:5-methyltetrahydropteroyltriglutamate--homocysteine methyltransferase